MGPYSGNSTASGFTYHKVFFNYEKSCTLSTSTLVFIVSHHITILLSKDSAPMAPGCIKQNCDGKGWSKSGRWTRKQKTWVSKVQTCCPNMSCPKKLPNSSSTLFNFNPKGDCMLNIWWVVILFLTDSNTGWHFLFMEIDNTRLEDEHSEGPSCTAMGTVVIFVPYTQERGTTTESSGHLSRSPAACVHTWSNNSQESLNLRNHQYIMFSNIHSFHIFVDICFNCQFMKLNLKTQSSSSSPSIVWCPPQIHTTS